MHYCGYHNAQASVTLAASANILWLCCICAASLRLTVLAVSTHACRDARNFVTPSAIQSALLQHSMHACMRELCGWHASLQPIVEHHKRTAKGTNSCRNSHAA